MSLTSLKATHTRYRNIVEREIKIANDILHEDISLEERDVKRLLKKAKLCEKRLSEFSEKLDSTKDALTNILESEKRFEDIERIVEEDCSLFSEVTDLLFELTEFVADVKSKIEEVSDKEKPPKDIDLKHMFDLQTEIQKQMKDLIVIQQENIKHQKETFEAKRDERTDMPSMRLPMLELKHYDGDRLKWLEFWDSFHSTIHANKRLSNIEKFNYLTSILRGEAKGVIDGLSLSNDNYFVALKLLSERFGETQNVIDTHYTQLINLKPATTKTESLRVLYDLFEKNLRSLETLEQDVNQAVFISMLTSKLPMEVLTQLELQKGAKNKWSVQKLRDLLHDYICAKERAEQQASSDKEAQRPQTFNQQSGQASASGNSFMNNHGTNKFHQETRQLKMSTEALFTGQNETSGGYNGTKSYKDLCRYCEGRHWSDECKKYKTVDERKKQIRGSCYLCLKSGHNAGDCKSGKTCVHCKRQNHHHRSLCPSKFLRESREIAHVAEEICTQKELKSENMLVLTEEIVLMQTAKTELKNPDLDMTDTARILLDSGSQRTYITESMANKLKLQLGDINEIRLVTFGEERAKIIKTPTAHVDIKLNDGTYMTMTVNVVPKIAGEIVRRPVSVTNNDGLNHLFGSIVLADTLPAESETSSIELLIGNDYYLDVVLPQRMEIQPGLYLLSSRFGWILTGRTSDDRDTVQHSMLILTYGQDVQRETTLYSDLDKSVTTNPNLKDFWNLENIGINDPLKDKGDDEALIKFNNSVRYENERYFVSWPWKDENSLLPVNYELAFGRLRTLLHKLKKNPDLMKQYDQIIQEQKSQGIIEQVPTNSNAERLHYIPHHAVLRPTKTTTKVRIVFDASAKTKSSNNSLNDCLYRGPVMLRDLSGLLIRFRMNEIALTADIEKAFLQVGLLPTDQDVTRFLWVKDTKLQPVKDNLQEYRFRRIPFGIVSSPFLLAATLKYHMDKDQSKTTERLQNDIYVDNLITGVKSVVEAVDTYRESRKIFDNASMNLREWMSNSQEVMNSIPVSDHAKNKNMNVLGMFWNSTEDKISLQSNVKQNGKMETKEKS